MSIDKPRCTHYCPCYCPLLPEYAKRPLRRDEWSPEWLQKPIEDEEYYEDEKRNKITAERMKRHRWRYMKNMKDAFTRLFFNTTRVQENPPKIRSFRWLMSSHHVPEGYRDGRAPWRILMRSYFRDLPQQLSQRKNRLSIKSWRKYPAIYTGKLHDRTELDNAPPEVACGRRVVFSLPRRDSNQSFIGDWFIVVYLWATNRTWAEKTDMRDLISFCSLVGIRAWEWVDAVDAPTETPYLFYQLRRERKDWGMRMLCGGLPYKHYDTVPMQVGDPVPTRLAGLSRLMDNQARNLLYATYEYNWTRY